LARYYAEVCPANEAHWVPDDAEHNPRYARYERTRFRRLHRTIRRYHSAPSAVLDVGGQGGASLRAFVDAGASCYVVDPGLALYPPEGQRVAGYTTLDDLLADGVRLDCAFSLQTFEHLFAPAEVLAKIVSAVQPGGVVLIEVPFDLLHLDTLLDRPTMPPAGELHAEHLNYWTPSGLEALARCCGLDVLDVDPTLQIAKWGGAIPSLTFVGRVSPSSSPSARVRSQIERERRRIRRVEREQAVRNRVDDFVRRWVFGNQ
jgi:SAM-dependent methyltransferase